MRIVSLLPSATEILFALGLGDEIVGVSHECDFPPAARTKQVVIQSRIAKGATPAEIDTQVREYLSRGESLYAVDAQALEALKPDLIVTQDLCHVCAATPDDLATALSRFAHAPEILTLNPLDLGDVWRDILWVGEETGRVEDAELLLEKIGAELESTERTVAKIEHHPRVAFLEWLDPFYVGGHWVPQMIERAGGIDLFGSPRKPTFRVTLQDIVESIPDVILISPCGYSAEQARTEIQNMSLPDQWNATPAVRNNRVYALEANGYFSRPGPRLTTGIEILAKALHPFLTVSAEAEQAILPVKAASTTARAASI
ncbi:MAG: cobalamin-binding protein [Candidatus Acidiferrum sp.]|jgi:iron complex transport system substrate-binding protein